MQPMPQPDAEVFAAQAMAWIVGDETVLISFLGWSGMNVDTLRQGLSDPDVLGSALDFVLLDDASVLALSAHLECPPDAVKRARGGLPGGEDVHWT